MKTFKVVVRAFRKPAVLNPEEIPVCQALNNIGFPEVIEINIGKCFIVTLNADTADAAKESVRYMCERMLVNLVTDHFEIEKIDEVVKK